MATLLITITGLKASITDNSYVDKHFKQHKFMIKG